MSFQDWYKKNREKLAESRKKRYDADPEYRKKRRAEAKRYYWLKKRRAGAIDAWRVDAEDLEMEPDRTISIVVGNEDDVRHGMTVMVPVFYPRSVAKLLKRSVQTFRLWSLRGYLPEVTYRDAGGARLVTEDQFEVLATNRHRLLYPAKTFRESPFFEAVREGWAELEPDGIAPMLKTEWRLESRPCPWCGKTPQLQVFDDETKEWGVVPCFECEEPTVVEERLAKVKTARVTAQCPVCEWFIDEERRIAGKLILLCPKCGARVNDYEVD